MEKLERYRGPLTLEQLMVARNTILQNAKELFNEASFLHKNGMEARAYFLLCIANEELGKYFLVLSCIVDLIAESVDWKQFWKQLRNHKEKTRTVEHIDNLCTLSEENFIPMQKIEKLIPSMEELKMASLYSDMFQIDFYRPTEIIPPDIVNQYCNLTEMRLSVLGSINISDEGIRSIKKEDVLAFRKKLVNMANDANDNNDN